MNHIRVVSLSLAIALLGLGGTGLAAGASCAAIPGTPVDGFATAPMVFVGTVTGTSDGDRTATVHVDELWRGPVLPAEVTLHGSPDVSAAATSVDRHYRSGQRYLFVPTGSDGPPFDDNSCSMTTEFTSATAAQRPTSAKIYPPAPASPIGPALVALATVVIAGALVVSLLITRRRAAR